MKKVLSIVLSIVMVLCMMPAMAFAGTADFTDAAAINHDAAVDTLVALGVFEGYPDGSFQPAKVVTRAEMAKTIATILNGGEAPVLSASTTSYTDTKGHWAAPYIEYCTSLGIVEGVGCKVEYAEVRVLVLQYLLLVGLHLEDSAVVLLCHEGVIIEVALVDGPQVCHYQYSEDSHHIAPFEYSLHEGP